MMSPASSSWEQSVSPQTVGMFVEVIPLSPIQGQPGTCDTSTPAIDCSVARRLLGCGLPVQLLSPQGE